MATALLPPSEALSLTRGGLAAPERFLRHCYSYLKKDAHLKVLKGHPSSSLSIIACCHCTLWTHGPSPCSLAGAASSRLVGGALLTLCLASSALYPPDGGVQGPFLL